MADDSGAHNSPQRREPINPVAFVARPPASSVQPGTKQLEHPRQPRDHDRPAPATEGAPRPPATGSVTPPLETIREVHHTERTVINTPERITETVMKVGAQTQAADAPSIRRPARDLRPEGNAKPLAAPAQTVAAAPALPIAALVSATAHPLVTKPAPPHSAPALTLRPAVYPTAAAPVPVRPRTRLTAPTATAPTPPPVTVRIGRIDVHAVAPAAPPAPSPRPREEPRRQIGPTLDEFLGGSGRR